jgi:hypothetical protein
MKQYLTAFLIGIGLAACCLAFFLIGKGVGYQRGYDAAMSEPHKADTVTVETPVYIDRPIEITKWRDRERLVYVPKDSLIYIHDTSFVAMEREYKKYGDEEYEAVVSGIDPALDWIKINQKTQHITNTVVQKRNWSFGATLGPGVFYDFKEVRPGVGLAIGVTYSF